MSDFIPYFGKGKYLDRVLPYKFASLFGEETKSKKAKMNLIKKRGKILDRYNHVLETITLSGLALATAYWIKN